MASRTIGRDYQTAEFFVRMLRVMGNLKDNRGLFSFIDDAYQRIGIFP